MPEDIIRRYHVDQSEMRQLNSAAGYWIYRMITSRNQLEEKIALFWHGLFATGYSKLNQGQVAAKPDRYVSTAWPWAL